MSSFINFIQTANVVLFFILLVAIIFCFMILSNTNRKLNRLRRRYDTLLRGRGELDMEGLIAAHSTDLENHDEIIMKLQEEMKENSRLLNSKLNEISGKSSDSIQKIGFHKYNAFEYVTNEMSFSLALLDSRSDGIIITSIFGRESSSTYAKEIRKGKGIQELSIEEEIALGRALQNG